MVPLLIPLLMMGILLETPNSTLSVVLLGLTFVDTIWLAGRIYRVGILSYGKTSGFGKIAKRVTCE